MKEFTFMWSIENISYSWHKTGEAIFSPTFTAGPIRNSSWILKLYPRGEKSPDCLGLYLKRSCDNDPQSLTINFEFACISADNLSVQSYKFTEADHSFTNNGGAFGLACFMKCHEVFYTRKALYLPQDVLTLRCRMWKEEGTGNEFGQSFGRTRLAIERVLLFENVNLEISGESIVNIPIKDKLIISIGILNCEESTRVVINPISVENIKFCTLKLSFMEKTLKKILCEFTNILMGAPPREIRRLLLICKAMDTGNKDSIENNVELQIEFVYSTGEEKQQIEDVYPESPRLPEFISKYLTSWFPCGRLSDCPIMSQDLWNLYEEDIFCDVELETQTASFNVHKIVICARSPVFLAMLTGDMKEKRNERIEIEDIVDDILEKFILFLYTDTFEDPEWDAVIGLYYASDKYQVERLKMICCQYLLKNASIENVCELLMLAEKHHDSDFKWRVNDFILQNDEKIFSSSTWERFVDEEPFLPAKTMILRYGRKREKDISAEPCEKILSTLPNVQDDFITAYKNGIVSDIVIKTTNATFRAHKAVLCASSSIMREEFSKDLKGQPTEVFEIPDLEDDIVSRVLEFLYDDSLGDVHWNTAIKLYHAADVYQIQRLKIKCSCFLLENLSVSNASELLLLAHEHQDSNLKSVVEDYIVMHDEEIFGSDEWAHFSESYPRLANETMRLKYRKNCDISSL